MRTPAFQRLVKQRLIVSLQGWIDSITRIINGNLSFGNAPTTTNTAYKSLHQNLDGVWIQVVTGTANVDMTITHSLNRFPQGYLIFDKSAACDMYTGSVAATKTQITLRPTVSGVTLQLFIF